MSTIKSSQLCSNAWCNAFPAVTATKQGVGGGVGLNYIAMFSEETLYESIFNFAAELLD